MSCRYAVLIDLGELSSVQNALSVGLTLHKYMLFSYCVRV